MISPPIKVYGNPFDAVPTGNFRKDGMDALHLLSRAMP
jgi:hypothetical protein